jgi:hypothetical protein
MLEYYWAYATYEDLMTFTERMLRGIDGALAEAMPEGLGELTAFDLGPGAPAAIAERLHRWLALGAAERASASASLAATVRARWSWEGVAESVLAASAGELDRLDPVPSG